jgi:hypothetical protein
MRRRQTWIGVLVMIAALLLLSMGSGHADRGRCGYKGYGYKGYGHRGARVFISPHIVVPFEAYGRPYWKPYPYPPVVIAPPPEIYVLSSPPTPQYWYYCDAAQAYYPYVQQCPGEWRPVLPTPPG